MKKKNRQTAKWGRTAGVFLLILTSWILTGSGIQQPEEDSRMGAAKEAEQTGALPETVVLEEKTEGEEWMQRLLAVSADDSYVSGTALMNGKEGVVSWEVYEDRDSLLAAFPEKKAAAVLQTGSGTVPWFFLKMPVTEDMHALDLYYNLQWRDAEEGYVYEAYTMDDGKAYEIAKVWKEALETEGMIRAKKEVVIRDGYLYLLECGNVSDGNREAVSEQMLRLTDILVPGSIGGWGLDEESLFWIDHTERVQTFCDPDRQFIERRGVDTCWPDEIMQYFALTSQARYHVQLAPDLPEMTITFRLADEKEDEQYEAYLLNGFCMDEPYSMEVRMSEDGTLLQEEQVNLNIDYIDTVRFTDVNRDGYLDMEISYLTYSSGYDGRDVNYRRRWLWNPEKEIFEVQKGRIR